MKKELAKKEKLTKQLESAIKDIQKMKADNQKVIDKLSK